MKRPASRGRCKRFADLRKVEQFPLLLGLQPPPDPRLVPYVLTDYYGNDNQWHPLGFEFVMWINVKDLAAWEERRGNAPAYEKARSVYVEDKAA